MYLRSRNYTGHPNYAQGSLGGKDPLACARNERYYSHSCFIWHWQANSYLIRNCPDAFRQCPVLGKDLADEKAMFASLRVRANPSLFLRDPWFAGVKSWETFDGEDHTGPDTPFSHIENYMTFAANLPGAPRGIKPSVLCAISFTGTCSVSVIPNRLGLSMPAEGRSRYAKLFQGDLEGLQDGQSSLSRKPLRFRSVCRYDQYHSTLPDIYRVGSDHYIHPLREGRARQKNLE